jgi:hypothetical protein
MHSYFYAIWSLSFLIIWVALYIFFPKHRRSMFWTSWNFAPAGPVAEYWHYSDYWHPKFLIDIQIANWHFGLEDYIITFSIAGVSAIFFETFASKRKLPNIPHVTPKTYFKMKMWGIVGLLLMLLICSTGLNSISAIILTMFIVAIVTQYGYWDIVLLAFFSTIIFTILYSALLIFLFIVVFPGVIQMYWNLENTMGITLMGIPIEEFIWAFFACLFAGPVYRICSTKTLFGKF